MNNRNQFIVVLVIIASVLISSCTTLTWLETTSCVVLKVVENK